jgi:hypothetical protein
MVTIRIDDDGSIRSSTPKTVKVRILRPVTLGAGITAIEGDLWELARADAIDLIAAESAERVTEPGEIEIQTPGLKVSCQAEEDPKAMLISRVPERERKPRAPTLIPLNGHLRVQGLEFVLARSR